VSSSYATSPIYRGQCQVAWKVFLMCEQKRDFSWEKLYIILIISSVQVHNGLVPLMTGKIILGFKLQSSVGEIFESNEVPIFSS
jgi:hypothetical protein